MGASGTAATKADARGAAKSAGGGRAALHAEPMRFGILRRVFFSAFVIACLVVGFGGWAAVAELSGAVISHGTVVVDGHAKKVQHKDGGIVSAINVRDGDHVQKGDILIVLDDTQTRAELGIIEAQLNELRARHARYVAERNGDDVARFPQDLDHHAQGRAIIAGETRMLQESHQTRVNQKEQLGLRISQLEKEIEGVKAQQKAKEKEIVLIDKELDGVRNLFARKLTPATRVYALEREQARLSGEHGNLISQQARLARQISEIQLQILTIDQSARTEAQRELRNAEARIAELRERAVSQNDRLGRMEIRAPQNGIVHELAVHTVGGVVTPAEPIMMIVPDGQALNIEVRIAPHEIDQVHIGQDVRLRFTAFNQRTTPERKGKISFVSADVSIDPKTRTEFYVATVAVEDEGAFTVAGQKVLPGMPVEAFITTRQRTALSYFVKPLTDQISRAFREE